MVSRASCRPLTSAAFMALSFDGRFSVTRRTPDAGSSTRTTGGDAMGTHVTVSMCAPTWLTDERFAPSARAHLDGAHRAAQPADDDCPRPAVVAAPVSALPGGAGAWWCRS